MLKSFFKGIDCMTNAMITITFSMLCIIIFAQVVTRYVLSLSLPWAEEIGRFLFLALSYLGITVGMKRHAHLRVDILLLYMPSSMKKFFEIIAELICALFFLFIVYEGTSMTMKVYRIDQLAVSIPLPIWIVWACIPFSSFLTLLQCLKNIYEIVSGHKLDDTGAQV